MHVEMKTICNYIECTGCSACFNICPHHAIEMKEDKFGELHPVINTSKCSDCGICQKNCPTNNKSQLVKPRYCYAAWNSDTVACKESASGGVAAYMYSTWIKEHKGIVYGVGWNHKLEPHFIRLSSLDKLEQLRGSKYVQAYVDDTFQQVKSDLQEELFVLFIGTPCQIAGLKAFLAKEYSNLLTCDLLCHGVPPFAYLRQELSSFPKKLLRKTTKCRFRGNDEYNYCFSLWDGETLLYSKKAQLSYYLYGFLTSITLRESCYRCKFTSPKRGSDITIGDFLGIKRLKSLGSLPKNISVVTINSEKGERFWKEVYTHNDTLHVEEQMIEEAVKGGGSFRKPAERNQKRNTFKLNYKLFGWNIAIHWALWKSILKTKLLILLHNDRL
jgi:coenzyme F420-reducing hydrogenase beta subunit